MKALTRIRVYFMLSVAVAAAAAMAGSGSLLAQDAAAPTGVDRVTPAVQATAPNITTDQENSNPAPLPAYGGDAAIADNYVIGPEDLLKIKVFEVPDLDETVRVANDGTIVIPLLGRLSANGLTPEQLRNKIEIALSKNLVQNPQVSVFVQEYHSQPVSVIGAVEKPGLYHITGPRTLIEVLSMAGGLAKHSSQNAGSTLYVTRESGFPNLPKADGLRLIAPDKLEIDIKDLLYSRKDALNISIKPHDIISVSKAEIVYVTGRGVQKPGGFVLEDRDKITVLQALAMAEGLSVDAAKHQARILHTNPDGTKKETRIDIGKIIKDKAPDPVLAADDILFVPDSAQKAALHRGSEVILSTLSGVLIFK